MRTKYTQKCNNWPGGWVASNDVVTLCQHNAPENSKVGIVGTEVWAEWIKDKDPLCFKPEPTNTQTNDTPTNNTPTNTQTNDTPTNNTPTNNTPTNNTPTSTASALMNSTLNTPTTKIKKTDSSADTTQMILAFFAFLFIICSCFGFLLVLVKN